MNERIQYRRLITFSLSLLIWGLMVGLWAYLWYTSFAQTILRPFGYKGNWLVLAVYGILLCLFNQIYGGYRIGYYKRGDVIFSGMLAAFITNVITYLQTCLIARALVEPIPFLLITVVDFLLVWVWCTWADKIYYKLYPPYQMLMIYGRLASAEDLTEKLRSRKEKYLICEAAGVDQGMAYLLERIGHYKAVVLCDIKAEQRNQILKYCYANGIRTYLTPKISDIVLRGAKDVTLFDTPLLLCDGVGLSVEQRILKRLLDLCVALPMLILFSPVMLFTAAAIKLQDGGSVLYKQERLTLNGRHFFVYKFRSMVEDAEHDTGAVLSAEGDDRITRVGRFIRKTRFDELPQLFNIIKGDMSLVGPRPERPELAQQNEAEIPEFAYRLRVPAGLTGYAQVVGRYNTTPYDKLKMDLIYIANYSILFDLKLILMTLKTIFSKTSTEGTKAKQKEYIDAQ